MLKRIDEELRLRQVREQELAEERRRCEAEAIEIAKATVAKTVEDMGWDPGSADYIMIEPHEIEDGIWKVYVEIRPIGYGFAELHRPPWIPVTVNLRERMAKFLRRDVEEAVEYATNPHYWAPISEREEAAEEEASSKPKLPPVPTLEELCDRLKEARDGKGRIKTEDLYAALLALIKALWDLTDAVWNRG